MTLVRVTVELDRPLRYVAGQYANVRKPQRGTASLLFVR